jgi:hypothetical protein
MKDGKIITNNLENPQIKHNHRTDSPSQRGPGGVYRETAIHPTNNLENPQNQTISLH